MALGIFFSYVMKRPLSEAAREENARKRLENTVVFKENFFEKQC